MYKCAVQDIDQYVRKKKIHGNAYISTHHNDEFEFLDECFINYAIPVLSVDMGAVYCKRLCPYSS